MLRTISIAMLACLILAGCASAPAESPLAAAGTTATPSLPGKPATAEGDADMQPTGTQHDLPIDAKARKTARTLVGMTYVRGKNYPKFLARGWELASTVPPESLGPIDFFATRHNGLVVLIAATRTKSINASIARYRIRFAEPLPAYPASVSLAHCAIAPDKPASLFAIVSDDAERRLLWVAAIAADDGKIGQLSADPAMVLSCRLATATAIETRNLGW